MKAPNFDDSLKKSCLWGSGHESEPKFFSSRIDIVDVPK